MGLKTRSGTSRRLIGLIIDQLRRNGMETEREKGRESARMKRTVKTKPAAKSLPIYYSNILQKYTLAVINIQKNVQV